MSPNEISVKSAPGSRNNMCKGPEAAMCLMCGRNSKERVAELGMGGMGEGDEVTEVMGVRGADGVGP